MGPRAPSNTMVERRRILLALDELLAFAFMGDRAIEDTTELPELFHARDDALSTVSGPHTKEYGAVESGFVPAPVSIVMAPQVQYLSGTPRFHKEGRLRP